MTQLAIIEQQSTQLLGTIAEAAKNPDVDVDKMQALLDMQERVMNRAAKAAFTQAIHAFQEECPEIPKSRVISVRGRRQSSYCAFEDMMRVIRPIMVKHGLTASFNSDDKNGRIEVICTLSHKDGFDLVSKFAAPSDKSGSKNDVQAVGSSLSYGKRYSLAAALGLVFAEEDDDGNATSPPESAPTAAKAKPRTAEERAQMVNNVQGRMEAEGVSDKEVNDAMQKLGKAEEGDDWRNLSDSVVAYMGTNDGFLKVVNAIFEK